MTLTGTFSWTVGLCNSCIAVMAGRWIMYDNGAWDFKIDNDRMGRAVDSSVIRGTAPVEIETNKDFRIFKALHRADKSVNLFVTFRECVAGEMIYLRSERSGGMVLTSKDEDKSGEPLEDGSGANQDNTASDNLPQEICSEQDTGRLCLENIAVDNGNNREANIVASSGEMAVDAGGNMEMFRQKMKAMIPITTIMPGMITFETIAGLASGKSASGKGERSSADVGFSHNQATKPVESGDVFLDTPPKQYNTHNRDIEDDDDVFADPRVTESTQVQGGEALMKGIQVAEMYGYNDVDAVYNEMDGSSCQPLDIDFIKEDSDIYVGRTFKDKAECKLTLAIYAIAKVCTFKLRHCKHRITVKCYDKECNWRVLTVQLGDSPTYLVKKAILNHVCQSDVRGKYKKHAIASVRGTEEMSYKMLPQYFHVLKLANSGTITDIKTEIDKEGKTMFKYGFMSLNACIDGWKHLRKVLVVDGTHMFGKYKDRCAAFFAAKVQWYPRAHHGICLVHLQRNVQEKYKGKQQKAMVGRAGEAFRASEFNEMMELIKLTDWRCWDYLEKIDKKLWTRSHFEGERFNVMTSNAAESLNKALLPARDSPIMAFLEFIRRMLCRWYESRRCEISKMKGNVPNKIEKILVEQLVLSTDLLVLPCSTWVFEVTHKPTGFSFTVDLEKRTCTCLEFQMLGLPCRHAIAAASFHNMQYIMFVCKHHVKETWAETVKGIILLVPDPKDVQVPAEILKVDLYLPMTKRTKGRPGIKRKLSAGEVPGASKKNKPNKCSNCFKEGHKKITYKKLVP
ncbi:hypothetical protein Bca4012_037833 [Brassica carinata]